MSGQTGTKLGSPDSKVHGANTGPTGPRWTPCWPHELYYLGIPTPCNIVGSLLKCHRFSPKCSQKTPLPKAQPQLRFFLYEFKVRAIIHLCNCPISVFSILLSKSRLSCIDWIHCLASTTFWDKNIWILILNIRLMFPLTHFGTCAGTDIKGMNEKLQLTDYPMYGITYL